MARLERLLLVFVSFDQQPKLAMFCCGGSTLPNKSDHNDGKMMVVMGLGGRE